VPVVEGLPEVSRNVLAYVIAFFREVAAAEARTKFGLAALAKMFGGRCLRRADGKKGRAMGELGKAVLQSLIKGWDTGEVYPIDESCFT
jgi:hypothetical protein